MPSSSKTEQERIRAAQVGLLMRAYRESFPREDGRRGITQTELLRRMGYVEPEYARRTSHGAVSRWESGVTPLTAERIQTFGKALNLSDEEIDGLILLAGLDPSYQESRTLTCPKCGGETVAAQVSRNQNRTGDDPAITTATRMRRCLSCGGTAESSERWSDDPREAGNQRMKQILNRIEGANGQIRQALCEANTLHGSPADEEELEGNSGPGSGEEVTNAADTKDGTGKHQG